MENLPLLLALCEGIPSVTGIVPLRTTNNSELCFFFVIEQTVELPVLWSAMTPMWRHCNAENNALLLVDVDTNIR